MNATVAGSSPRERGTPQRLVAVVADPRFIPARAGNAPSRARRAPTRRFIPARAGNAVRCRPGGHQAPVHPRASGERQGSPWACSCACGSSPRERGTPRARAGRGPHGRFIPARAGNASTPAAAFASTAVHPRASGERKETLGRTLNTGGSSPRERGTPEPEPLARRVVRFIPARAGNAGKVAVAADGAPVHPRASGERDSQILR